MHKLFLVLLLLVASGVYADEIKDGRVMCTVSSDRTASFDLIKVRRGDREYTGNYETGDLRFSGAYRSVNAAFKFNVNVINEEGDAISELLLIESKLPAGENLHVKFKRNETDIELYCYFFPNT